MSSSNKRFSLGWAIGIFLGLICAGAFVYAGSIATTYSPGDPLTAADMNAIVSAVNQVQGNAGNGTCVTNNLSDEMVRVGPICVDKYRATLWNSKDAGASPADLTGCNGDGTGCSGVFAQSRASGTPADGTTVSWAMAAAACANAGKRLLTPGEWLTARAVGTISGIVALDTEYVDGFASSASNVAQAGNIGPIPDVRFVANLPYDATNPDPAGSGYIKFRCAR